MQLFFSNFSPGITGGQNYFFWFIAFITAYSSEKLNIEKWPELGSGQKYVTLPYRALETPGIEQILATLLQRL